MDNLEDHSRQWRSKPPALPQAIATLLSESQLDLPQDYLDFLAFSNGGEGELGIEPGWFQLWPGEDVLEANRAYNVQGFLPGFVGFGSNGGGELFAFDSRTSQPWKVCMIPFTALDEEEVVVITADFAAFVEAVGRSLDH